MGTSVAGSHYHWSRFSTAFAGRCYLLFSGQNSIRKGCQLNLKRPAKRERGGGFNCKCDREPEAGWKMDDSDHVLCDAVSKYWWPWPRPSSGVSKGGEIASYRLDTIQSGPLYKSTSKDPTKQQQQQQLWSITHGQKRTDDGYCVAVVVTSVDV